MRRIVLMLIFSTAFIGGVAFANTDEPLFDTKAAASHIEKGLALLNAKNYNGAISELEEAVSIAPDAEGYYYLGYAYYMKGKKNNPVSRKKAIEAFNEAYELDPNFTPTKFKPAEPGLGKKQESASAPATPRSQNEEGLRTAPASTNETPKESIPVQAP